MPWMVLILADCVRNTGETNIDTEQQARIHRVADEVRTWGAVAIIGAGTSFMRGLPLTPQLRALLWHAVESDASLSAQMAVEYRMPGKSAKEYLGDDQHRLLAASMRVAQSPTARQAYQNGFCVLDQERRTQFSIAHDALAVLLHQRKLEMVVSFNWDTLLETAYRRRFGRWLFVDGPWLFKPHGDAAHPEHPWILPHDAGSVPGHIVARVDALISEHPRVLLIIGYSESDEEVVKRLIDPLSNKWRKVRIGPNVAGDNDIALSADEALQALVQAICPGDEVPGWEYVNFDNQHDLSHALSGRRLGPADVETCPRLPEVDLVRDALVTTNSAILTGRSGCGKSITAYQAAYDMCQQDWEVLRLNDYNTSFVQLVGAIEHLPHRSILIVDDAQAADARLLRRLLEMASVDRGVLFVSTDKVAGQEDCIQISASRAVTTLAQALIKRKVEIFPIVRSIDNWVGDGSADISLDDRLQEAARSDTPWQFCFVLTGGWRRAKDQMALLRDHDRSDLLLASVAAGQMVSADAGVTRTWVQGVARGLGYDGSRIDREITFLKQQKAIVGEETLRCPHIQYAALVLHIVCVSRDDPKWEQIITMLRTGLTYEHPPLRGISWLLNHLRFLDAFRGNRARTVVDDDTWHRLLESCWASKPGEERRDALFVLNALRGWHEEHVQALHSEASTLGKWLEGTDAIIASAMGSLLNDLSHNDPTLASDICDQADPEVIASSIAQALPSEAFAWGELLGRLAATATPKWKRRLARVLDRSAFLSLAASFSARELYGLAELVQGLIGLNVKLGIDCVDVAVPTLAAAINSAPAETYSAAYEIIVFALACGERINAHQHRVAKHLAMSINVQALAGALSISPRRYWVNFAMLIDFIANISVQQARKVAANVNFSELDKIAKEYWQTIPRELEQLIGALALGDNAEPARSWVERHEHELTRLTPILARVCPKSVAARLKAGLSLDLDVGHGLGWERANAALKSLADVDPLIAMQVASDNHNQIAEGLINGNPDGFTSIAKFMITLRQLAPAAMQEALASIFEESAETAWMARLQGKPSDQLEAIAILDIIAATSGPLAILAAKLRLISNARPI